MSWNSVKFTPAEEWNAGFNRYPKIIGFSSLSSSANLTDDERQALGAASRPEKFARGVSNTVELEIQALREPLGSRHILAIDSDT
jgi:hypothetical protein